MYSYQMFTRFATTTVVHSTGPLGSAGGPGNLRLRNRTISHTPPKTGSCEQYPGHNEKYPEYNLSQHKVNPTAAHMSEVRKIGASPIHGRTFFVPSKHMGLDDEWEIIG